MSATTAYEDLAGLSPVYYNPDDLHRGFVSTPENAVASPQVDRTTVAASIVWPGINPLVEGYSYFQGVRRLRPGEHATITDDKLHIQSQYPSENTNATFNGTAERLGGALLQDVAGVVAREADSISTDFSGGLDSSPLGLAAANHCPPGRNVLGLVQYSEDYPAGDIRYARRFAKLNANLILRELITGDGQLPYVRMPSGGISPSEPYRGTDIFGREDQRLAGAGQYHITGVGGDSLFDPDPTPILVDLLLSGEQDLAKQIALHTGRATLQNPADILERARIKSQSNLTQSLERVATQLTTNNLSTPSKDWLPSLGVPAQWLTPEMREAVAARAAEVASGMSEVDFSLYATRQAIADSGDAHRHLSMLAKEYGVNLVAPYLGEAALGSVLDLSAAMRIRPGQFKPLLRAASAAEELAPDEIFTIRKGKGAYSAEMRAGFDRALPDIKAMLEHSRLARLGIIDAEAVMMSLSQRRPPLASLSQLIASENWLAHLGIDGVETQRLALRGRSEVKSSVEAHLPYGNFSLVPSLHIVAGPNGQLAAFDPERGVFLPPVGRSRTTRLILQSLAEHNSPQAAVGLLHREYAHVPVEQLTSDVASTVRGLTEHGWLQSMEASEVRRGQLPSEDATQMPSVEAGEVMRVRDSTLSLEDAAEAEMEAIGRAYISMRELIAADTPFTELTRHLVEGNSRAVRPASYAESLRALELARLVTANDTEHRVACYELSLTAALFCIASGLSVDWCLGISFGVDKPGYHAWIEVEGVPLRGEADEVIEGVYHRVLSVGDAVKQ